SSDVCSSDLLPWIIGARYQTRLNRGEIILLGIRHLNDYSLKNYNERFDELASEDQDDILKQFEDNKVQLPGVEAQTFFYLLVQLTRSEEHTSELQSRFDLV